MKYAIAGTLQAFVFFYQPNRERLLSEMRTASARTKTCLDFP